MVLNGIFGETRQYRYLNSCRKGNKICAITIKKELKEVKTLKNALEGLIINCPKFGENNFYVYCKARVTCKSYKIENNICENFFHGYFTLLH